MLYTRVYTVVYTWVYSCVHVGIQLCTHVYTHPSQVRGIHWESLHLGHGYFYLRRILPHDLALAL